MAQAQTQVIEIRPGEIVSFGDRIAWCTLTPSNPGTDICIIVYTPFKIDDTWIQRAKEKKDPTYLEMGYWLTMSREAEWELRKRIKPFRIKKLAMGWASILQYYDLYEMRVPMWRRILAIFRPIKMYGYRWDPKEKKIEMIEIHFKGLKLKPKIVKRVTL